MPKPSKPISSKTVGTVPISNTQQLRVEIVEGGENNRIAIQKWWRESESSEWVPSKGIFPTKEQAEQLIKYIQSAIDSM